MSRGAYPLVAWGSADDLSASPWTDGGVGVSGSLTDPFGGTGAFSLQDNSGAALEYRRKPITFAASGTQYLYGCVRQNPTDQTAQGLLQIVDETAGVERGGILCNFSGTTLTSVAAYQSVTVLPAVLLGDSWYYVHALVPSIVAGNTNALRIYPASTAVGTQSTMRVYLRRMVLLNPLDSVVAFERPREGSDFVQGPSGTEESWVLGPDEVLKGQVRHIPADPRSNPGPVSGWYGRDESVGVNAGVKAMLRAGREKTTLRFVPDRSLCTTYMDSYLSEPMTEAPGLEEAGSPDLTFPIELRGSTVYGGVL